MPSGAKERGAVVGAGAALAWLAAAAFLFLCAMVASIFSVVGLAVFAAWAVGAAIIGFRLLGAQPTAPIQVISVIAGGASALIAAGIALGAEGTELLWSVVALCTTAGLYSLIAYRRAGSIRNG